ncbi:MAG: RNA polymerase sigma factor [Polyangiaceae bacterium]
MRGSKVVPLAAARGPGTPLERTDEELMLLVRAGSREAMAVLASRYLGPLTSFCVKRTGDPGAAEDIVQEVFLRLWVHRAEWTPRGTVAALLYTSARNLCINRARDKRRRGRWIVPSSGSVDVERAGVASEEIDPILARERRRDALLALGELPDAQREALLLRFDAELTYEAIATIAGTNESTVRSRVHHGLLKLRALVGRKGDAR